MRLATLPVGQSFIIANEKQRSKKKTIQEESEEIISFREMLILLIDDLMAMFND